MRLFPLTGWPPESSRLLEVAELMNDTDVVLRAEPALGQIHVDGELPDWGLTCLRAHHDNLVYWWRASPMQILACSECGTWRAGGSKSGGPCWHGGKNRLTDRQKKMRMTLVNPTWGCQGQFEVVKLPWAARRPNRRRTKLEGAA